MKLFLCLFFVSYISYAQEFALSGKITDTENNPITFVTVLLLKVEDSIYVKGATTNESGTFLISDIKRGKYLVKATYIGYEPLYKKVHLSKSSDIGVLQLREAEEVLDEVEVHVEKPTVQKEPDRIIFNVENTSLSSGSTWEILNKTPGVIIQQNNLTVQNQNATIFLNDKKVHLSSEELRSLLQGYSGANIKAVEVITKPSAKYEADSGVIINIITSKNVATGYKGNISANYTQAIFPKYRFNTSHFFKNDWINFFIDYSTSPKKEQKRDLGEVTFFDENNNPNSYWESDFLRVTRYNTHNINSSIDIELSQKSSLNITSTLLFEPNTTYNNREETEMFGADKQLDSIFRTDSSLDHDKHNLAFDAVFTQDIGDKGALLKANAHYTDFDHRRHQTVATNYFLPDGTTTQDNFFQTNADQQTKIYVGKLDSELPLWGSFLETGIHAAGIDSKSWIDFFDEQGGADLPNEALSDLYYYDETILAGYTQFSKGWEKWQLVVGLRGEYTIAEGNSVSMGLENKQEYFELFPSTSLTFSPNEKHNLSMGYKRSINRPSYDVLNPFRYFINENNFTSGNPNLVPGITQRYSLGYTLKKKYNFEFYYRRGENEIEILSLQNNTNRFLNSVSTNLKEKIGYGLNFTYDTSIFPWWYFSNYTALFHEENTFPALESQPETATVAVEGILFYTYNNISLSKDKTFSSDVTFTYLSDLVSGSYYMDPYATLNIGLRKTLWENRAVVTLGVNDVFNTTNRKLHSNYLNQDNSYYAILETRNVQFGFTYNFGNFRLRDNSREIKNEQRGRIK